MNTFSIEKINNPYLFIKTRKPKMSTSDARSEVFTTLLMWIFLNNPIIDIQSLGTISQEAVIRRYGVSFQNGLHTFGRLSDAEQVYLINHLQK